MGFAENNWNLTSTTDAEPRRSPSHVLSLDDVPPGPPRAVRRNGTPVPVPPPPKPIPAKVCPQAHTRPSPPQNATLRNTRLVHSVPNHFTHSVPSLISNEKFIKNGIPGVFTPSAFDTAWTKYQGHLVQNLNRLIDGTPPPPHHAPPPTSPTDASPVPGTDYQNMSVIDIAIASARQADLAATFNYASQAHNNHFFFTSLVPKTAVLPRQPAYPPPPL